ncbi:MAG: hypothetical protein K2J13_05420, partial [Clostridia bacterium]|nr:hypothetical protein [Clostridia bacterium]
DVNYEIENKQTGFVIDKVKVTAVWNTSEQIPILSNLDESTKAIIGYVYYDEDGNPLDDNAQLEAGKSYKVKAIFLGDNAKNYEFVTEDGQPTPNESAETSVETFTITAGNSGGNLGGITGGDEQETPPEPQPATSIDLSNILNALKENWQPIIAVMSLLFTIIFMGKGIGYAGKRKKVKKTIDKRYTAYYAISGVGLFGLPNTTWTVIACIMAGVAVLAFIFMLLQKRMYNKALEDMEDAKEEYNRTFMRGNMSGGMGMGQQGVVYAQQPQLALEDMRGMINEAMSNMLPNVTQYLPQEASYNEELIQQLIDQNAQNEERIRQLTEQNEERIRQLTAQNEELMRNLAQGQEMLMQKFAEEKKDAEKETVSEDVIEKLVEKLAKQQEVEKEAEK